MSTAATEMSTSSVELTHNAKGRIQAVVKVYDENPEEAADKAVAVLLHIRAKLSGQMAE